MLTHVVTLLKSIYSYLYFLVLRILCLSKNRQIGVGKFVFIVCGEPNAQVLFQE